MNRMSLLAAASFAFVLPLLGQAPPSEMISARALRATGDELLTQAKAAPDGIAFKVLLTRPDGAEQLAVRVKSGQGEWHRDFADVLVALEGHAQIMTGGQVVNGKTSAPGEIRGDSVQGGKVENFDAGDVIRIEPQVAHQMLLQPGTSFRYFVVKVRSPK